VSVVNFDDSVGAISGFRSVGLTPRKSLTLGAIRAPDRFIVPLARGLMDGDGGIANFVGAPTIATYPKLPIRTLNRDVQLSEQGASRLAPRPARRSRSGLKLLRLFYADPKSPRLLRKWQIWNAYLQRASIATSA
jgi:hypothetical protein